MHSFGCDTVPRTNKHCTASKHLSEYEKGKVKVIQLPTIPSMTNLVPRAELSTHSKYTLSCRGGNFLLGANFKSEGRAFVVNFGRNFGRNFIFGKHLVT